AEPISIDPVAVIARAAASVNGSDAVTHLGDDPLVDSADIIARAAIAANGSGQTREPIETVEDRQAEPVKMETPQTAESERPTEITHMIPTADEPVQRMEPAWCDLYLPDEIGHLQSELAELNEVVVSAQRKIREVESRIALTRGLRAALLAG